MLSDSPAFSSFSTNDIDKAIVFYGEVLGLNVKKTEMGIVEIAFSNDSTVMVYPKNDHQAASFTVLNFPVSDVDATVDELREKGVTFEQYDSEAIQTDEKGISRGTEGPAIAWFKDPAGNILSIIEA